VKLSYKVADFGGRKVPDPEVRSRFHLTDPSKVLSLISEAGFIQPLYFSEFYQYPFKSPQAIADLLCTYPTVAAIETVDAEHYQETKAMALREAEAHIIGEHRLFEHHGVVYIMKKPPT
jgi:hypothetical protein